MKKILFLIAITFIAGTSFAQHQWGRWLTADGTNTYTAFITVPSPPSSYTAFKADVKFQNANTGPSTINFNGIGSIPIRYHDGTNWVVLPAGKIDVNTVYELKYNGSYFQMKDNPVLTVALQSLTGDGVDNTDPLNPVMTFPTPSEIGLGNVDNTSDEDKPVSIIQQDSLDSKVNRKVQSGDTEEVSVALGGEFRVRSAWSTGQGVSMRITEEGLILSNEWQGGPPPMDLPLIVQETTGLVAYGSPLSDSYWPLSGQGDLNGNVIINGADEFETPTNSLMFKGMSNMLIGDSATATDFLELPTVGNNYKLRHVSGVYGEGGFSTLTYNTDTLLYFGVGLREGSSDMTRGGFFYRQKTDSTEDHRVRFQGGIFHGDDSVNRVMMIRKDGVVEWKHESEISGNGGSIESVTGTLVDDTDPYNPVINSNVDNALVNGVTDRAPSQDIVYDNITSINSAVNSKQALLSSGSNIKSVNGTSILGAGELVLLTALPIACSNETTVIDATGQKISFRMPYAMTLTGVKASLNASQPSGSIFTIDIYEGGISVLGTKLTIDNTETTSKTAATAATITDTALAEDAVITIGVTQIGDAGAAGLKVSLIGKITP